VLGEELRKARQAAGLSQEKVATTARVSREYVSMIERGEYQPTVEVFMRVCAAIGVKGWRVLKDIEESGD